MSFLTTFTIIFLGAFIAQTQFAAANFYKYYNYLWGGNHFSMDHGGNNVQLLMDKSSGGSGFKSKLAYASGLFHIRMKIPQTLTGGVVTTFYLTTAPDYQDPSVNHFEFDYEFLGTNGTVQTNVYDNDGGHREQSYQLWFDPSKDFHTYEFLWNPHTLVFRIDNIPVREFKNKKASGVPYPRMPMRILASIWDADWAGVVDWSKGPFVAQFEDFDFKACPAQSTVKDLQRCASPSKNYFWNQKRYWSISAKEKRVMQQYRKRYMIYDYCSTASTRKPECSFNN